MSSASGSGRGRRGGGVEGVATADRAQVLAQRLK